MSLPWLPPGICWKCTRKQEGYVLAPGAHAAIELDIMSEAPGLVGAETFAAVDPRNNNKLETDLLKLAARSRRSSLPILHVAAFPWLQEAPAMGADGIQVWSVDV